MTRMDRATGKLITGIADEIRASIEEILLTPVGSIPLFREFGSGLFDLIDAPQNRDLLIRSRVLDAISKWEPRVEAGNVAINKGHGTGGISIEVFYRIVSTGESSSTRIEL